MLNWFKKKPAATADGASARSQLPSGSDGTPGLHNLVPRIKTAAFLDVYKQMKAPPTSMPLVEPLAGGLLLTYAFDLPAMFKMMSVGDLSQLGIGQDGLRPAAIENLRKQLPQIGVEEIPPIKRVVTGNNLEACVLLADSWWDNIAANTDGEVVAVVPGRDYLLFCGSNSAEGIAALRQYGPQIVADEQQHGLTDSLIVWRDGKWVDFEP